MVGDVDKNAADEARDIGDCPGYKNNGCADEAKAVLGRIYCAPCQKKVKDNGPAVQESHRKAAERSKGIHITVPFSTQLTTLGATSLRSFLPAATQEKLLVNDICGVDTAAANRSVESKFMYIVGAYKVDQDGTESAFWASRKGTDEEWLSAEWNVRINNVEVQGGDIFAMLFTFSSFAYGRQIIFSTGNNACDYKRLTSAYKWNCVFVSPFPPENEWFNIGKELVSKVIDHNGIIKSPNWKLPKIHSNLYQIEDSVSIPTPDNYIEVLGGFPDTIRDAIWAMNVINCFKNVRQ